MNRSRRRRRTCTPTSPSRKLPWRSSSRTSAASEPASSRTTACSPFWRRSERPDYAEWNGAAVDAIDGASVTTACHTKPVRHSSAGDINLQTQRCRTLRLPVQRAHANGGWSPHQPPRRTAAVDLENRKSCQDLTDVQAPDAYLRSFTRWSQWKSLLDRRFAICPNEGSAAYRGRCAPFSDTHDRCHGQLQIFGFQVQSGCATPRTSQRSTGPKYRESNE